MKFLYLNIIIFLGLYILFYYTKIMEVDLSQVQSQERQNLFILPENTGALFHKRKNPEDKHELVPFKFIEKKQISHDTFIFILELPEDQYLGINLGQHIAIE
jgi:hypothetical protein